MAAVQRDIGWPEIRAREGLAEAVTNVPGEGTYALQQAQGKRRGGYVPSASARQGGVRYSLLGAIEISGCE